MTPPGRDHVASDAGLLGARSELPFWRRLVALIAVALALTTFGCEGEPEEASEVPVRGRRFGALRDLVLFQRPARLGGPFLLDRFETSCADWESWLTQTARPLNDWARFDLWNDGLDPQLPVVGVDLAEARRHAAWRFCRIPRWDEWDYAATARGQFRLPWGDLERSAWANTQELGLSSLTPVGTFESGRQRGGCYDLVGNASEWTETAIDGDVFSEAPLRRNEPWDFGAFDLAYRLDVLDGHPAWRPWRVPGSGVWPLGAVLGVHSGRVARACAPGMNRPMAGSRLSGAHFWASSWRSVPRLPTERSSGLGFRLALDPRTFLRAVGRDAEPLGEADLDDLRAFVRREDVRPLLQARDAAEPDLLGPDPGQTEIRTAASVVREELRG